MKRIVSFLVAAVMVLSVFGMLHVASPIKAAAEGTNLALGKPVTESLSANLVPGDTHFWSKDYLTDGRTVAFTGTEVLGWLVYTSDLTYEMDASVVVDLQSTYSIGRVTLVKQAFVSGAMFPNVFDVYVSEDNVSWTLVKSFNSHSSVGTCGAVSGPVHLNFDNINARYVKIRVLEGSDCASIGGTAGAGVAGFDEIEVYSDQLISTGNVALGKPVAEIHSRPATVYNTSASAYWDKSFLTDGITAQFVGDVIPLGYYVADAGQFCSARVTVDLLDVYTISSISLVPMYWDVNQHFPQTFAVFTSEDRYNWTCVYREDSLAVFPPTGPVTFSVDSIDARYVSVAFVGNVYLVGGLGEIEVYGSFVKYGEPVDDSAIPGVLYYDAKDLIWTNAVQGRPTTITEVSDGVRITKPVNTDPAWDPFRIDGNLDDNGYVRVILPQTVDNTEHWFCIIEGYSSSGSFIVPFTENEDTGWGYFWVNGNPSVLEYPAGGSTAFPLFLIDREVSIPAMAIMGNGADVTIKSIAFYSSIEDWHLDFLNRGYTDYGFRNCIDFIDISGTNYAFGSEVPASFSAGEIDGDYVQYEGWASSVTKFNRVGYVVDDGEPVFDSSFITMDAAYIQANATAIWDANVDMMLTTGDVIYYNIRANIEEGAHTVKIVFDLEGVDDYIVFDAAPYSYTDVEYGVKTARLMLGSSLTLEAKVLFPDTVTSPKLKVVNSDNETTILEPVQTSGGFCYFDYSGIYPQKMAEEFTLTLLDGDTVFASALPTTYSVMEYADTLYNTTAEELGYTAAKKAALDTLLADMLTYGGAAQVYKDYDVENLADELDWVASTKTAQVPAPVSSKALLSSSEGDRIRSASIILDDVIRFVVLFKATDAEAVRFTSVAGTYTIARADWDPAGGQFTVFSAPVLAYELQNVVTVELLDGSSNVLAGITYSVESYIASGAIGTEDSYFTDALLCYGRSAYAFAQSA